MPRVRRVRARILAWNRSTALGAIRRFGIVPFDARTASVSFHTLVCLPEIFSLTDLLHPLLIRSQAFCTALRHGCFGPFIGRVPGFTRQPFPEGQLKLVLLPLCTFESCHVLASPIVQAFVHRSRLCLAVDSAFRPWSASLALPTTWPTMPSADSCCTFKKNRFLSSRESTTCNRSPVVSSTAFSAPPPDLPPLALMDMGFAAHCQLARKYRPRIRFLSIGTRFCSTLPSDPILRRRPCASLILHLHQVG